MITEFAPAKVNLTLHVTGQRDDGYHLLDSLVMFADVGDVVSVEELNDGSAGLIELALTGEGLGPLIPESNNSVVDAARRVSASRSVRIHLEKNLPVASGIGGGSTDAAASFRAMMRLCEGEPMPVSPDMADPNSATKAQIADVAKRCSRLGADFPVCLYKATTRMRGIGENLTFYTRLPALFAVLANPSIFVPTPWVFKELKSKTNPPMPDLPDFPDAATLIQWLKTQRNDMQTAAISLFPEIGAVIGQLEAQESCQLARMSGSGATCFGIFPDASSAQDAAAKISADHPGWWVRNCVLGG